MPSNAADALLSMNDGSNPLEVDCTPAIYIMIDGDTTWSFPPRKAQEDIKRISSDQKHQSLDSEGAKSKGTIKMDEPVAQ